MQTALARHLTAEGCEIIELADTESKAQGVDVLARTADGTLAVEVKGYPTTTYEHGPQRGQPKPTQPTNQARQWFSHALLGVMLLRDSYPDAQLALCFPAFRTYVSLIRRTHSSLEQLGVRVYLVSEDGTVRIHGEDTPLREEEQATAGATHSHEGGGGVAPSRTPGTCREEVLAAFTRLEGRHGDSAFAPADVVREVQLVTDRFAVSTIRTHVVSLMCVNAPQHHGTAYKDLERVGRGLYRRRRRG